LTGEIVRREVVVDGQRLSFSEAGPTDGPVVVLLHGLLSESTTWAPAMLALAERGVRALAPDLIGHGESDKPPIAYTLEDFADSLSSFLIHLEQAEPDAGRPEIGPVTMVGHSLGGAIAMQFAKSYPSQLGRLVLISAGGLGKKVHLILRAVNLPGAAGVLRMTVNDRAARLYGRPEVHRALRLHPDSVVNLTRMGRSLMSAEGRSTFVSATRSAITPSGQLGDMIEHGFVAADLPTLIIWSEGDPIIPVSHAITAHARLANSRLELFAGATHEPHRREPGRVAEAIARFIAETEPYPEPRHTGGSGSGR
jgi:pimeloyl-ACP methyl ester carboxylesterase